MSQVVTTIKSLFTKPANQETIDPFSFIQNLSEDELQNVLGLAEHHRFFELTPNLEDENVCLLSHQTNPGIIDTIIQQKPLNVVDYHFKKSYPHKHKNVFSVKGGMKLLGIKANFFKQILATLATCPMESAIISELSKILKNQSRIVLSIRHPFLDYVRSEKKHTGFMNINSFEQITTMFRDSNLYIEAVSEGTVDSTVRPLFMLGADDSYYRELMSFPLVLVVRAVKYLKS